MDTIWVDIGIGEISYDDNGNRIEKPEMKRRIELSTTFQSIIQNWDDNIKEILSQIRQEFKDLKKEI